MILTSLSATLGQPPQLYRARTGRPSWHCHLPPTSPEPVTEAGATAMEMDKQSRLGSPAAWLFHCLNCRSRGNILNSSFPGRLRAARTPLPCCHFMQPQASRLCHSKRLHTLAPLLLLDSVGQLMLSRDHFPPTSLVCEAQVLHPISTGEKQP